MGYSQWNIDPDIECKPAENKEVPVVSSSRSEHGSMTTKKGELNN